MLRFDGKKDPERRQAIERADGAWLWGADDTNHRTYIHPSTIAEYRKTATTYAVRMEKEFEVDTLEGLHTGKAGDFLAIGAAGELYPIDAAVFAATYEPVE